MSNSVSQWTKTFEPDRNLITQIKNMAGTNLISQFDYINDALGRRTRRLDASLSSLPSVQTNDFSYNPRSELISAEMGANSYAWQLDQIGNRISDTSNSVTHAYTANSLNQYTAITNGGLRMLSYDDDGNLTNDGVFAFTWDAENRLTQVEPLSLTNGAKRVQNAYDYMSRRISKKVYAYDTDHWNLVTDNSFVWDGWSLVQETQVSGFSTQVFFYVWGLDLSGSLQGAGGIGGLLSRISQTNSTASEIFYLFDANGNTTELINNDGGLLAHYEYSAYGEVTAMSGVEAENNAMRFSSKYWDTETGLGYWGFRHYSPQLSRWLNRDPILEEGFRETTDLPNEIEVDINNYVYLSNEPCGQVEYLGAGLFCKCPWPNLAIRLPGPCKPFEILKLTNTYNCLPRVPGSRIADCICGFFGCEEEIKYQCKWVLGLSLSPKLKISLNTAYFFISRTPTKNCRL